MGATYKGLNKICDAAETFQKVTEVNPTYHDNFNNLGTALKDQGKLKAAIASHQKALSSKNNYADAYKIMGNALTDQGKLVALSDRQQAHPVTDEPCFIGCDESGGGSRIYTRAKASNKGVEILYLTVKFETLA